jgi:hypothetical protein
MKDDEWEKLNGEGAAELDDSKHVEIYHKR